jgi:hypothetical protein
VAMFAYVETKKLREEQYRIEGRIDQLVASAIDQNTRLREVEKTYGSAETLRWAVGEITKLEKRIKAIESLNVQLDNAAERWGAGTVENLQKRIKALETSTKAPAGLEPVEVKRGGARFKGQRVPGSLRDRILKLLAGTGRPMHVKEIGQSVGSDSHRQALRLMANEGVVQRVSLGVYALPVSTYGGHTSRYVEAASRGRCVEAATLQCARSVGQNGRG